MDMDHGVLPMKGLVEQILRQRCSLEVRIRELGGAIPKRWPHDTDGQYRNLQLLELVEDLEQGRKNATEIIH